MLLVVKIGGDILSKGFPKSVIDDIRSLLKEHQIILVHGGGDIVSEISDKLGHPPRFVTSPKGFRSRYTDKETSEIYTMVMAGKINKETVKALDKLLKDGKYRNKSHVVESAIKLINEIEKLEKTEKENSKEKRVKRGSGGGG